MNLRQTAIMDAKVAAGGFAASFALADVQMWIGIVVGVATLVYVSQGIYMRYQKIKEDSKRKL